MIESIGQQVINGTMMGGMYILIALGLVLIYGVMHVLNFSHGVLFTLGGYLCQFFFTQIVGSYVLAILLSMASLMIVGTILERAIFRPLRDNLRNQVLVSLGLILVIQNLIIVIWGPLALTFKLEVADILVPLGTLQFGLLHFVIIGVAFGTVGLLYAFLTWTRFGTAIRATSQNREAAQVVGIDVNFVYWFTFSSGTALAALGGALMGPLFLVFPFMGDLPLLKGLAAIILGGMSSIVGTVIGALVIGITEAVSTVFISTDYRDAITFLAIVLVLLFRPQGIFGVRSRND